MIFQGSSRFNGLHDTFVVTVVISENNVKINT